MSTNVSEMLNKQITDQERPKPVPEGKYLFHINGVELKEFPDATKKDGSPDPREIHEIDCSIRKADPTIPKEAITEAGGEAVMRAITCKLGVWTRLNQDRDRGMPDFREVFAGKILGVKISPMSVSQFHEKLRNREFWGELKHRITENGSVFYDVNPKYGTMSPAS